MSRLGEVLSKHGLTETRFQHRTDGLDRFVAEFSFNGARHEIGVYTDDVTMMEGEKLFESYMREEFASNEALVEGFARRLDRYLSGGDWAGPNEKGLPDLLKEKLGRLFRRHGGDRS